MNKMIERLYDEVYSPKVSPEELINNVILPNYTSVNFESNNVGLLVTTTCMIDNDLTAEYKYQFDKEKKLLTLIGDVNGKTDFIYDRDKEIKRKYKEIKKYMNIGVQAV
ncbi:hypothetical protein [Oceanobacillus neutriphilus]|uniref:Uncharacterized protein n=1 Tax=Oceanobacillus neutriphilus TaxID=531815 RepID=A0ABQ2NUQ0_9BACI|nr:hypothetical protein [Oceanobacillus neutriphilus]GGP10978.1 hypothetical protein GCM10011346_21250 [Oceanobacillus neutriphilus]